VTTWDRFVRWLSKRDWGGAVDRHGHPTTTERGYIRSYIWLRLVVGGVGLLLPLILWIGEWFFLAAPVQARDSISSYYHSPMRDWFVASLAVIGVLLIAYMLGTWNKESVWSTIAGVALLGVAFLPTERPHLPKGAPLCEATPKPVDCTDLEHRFHEHTVGDIHMICAVVALFSLGVIALLFAGRAKWGDRRDPDNRLALTQLICGCVIFLSLADRRHQLDRPLALPRL